MNFTYRTYLIAEGDRIYRLASAKLDRMLRDPAAHRLPSFAGQRVRMATAVIEFAERKPVCVVRTTFAILTFDGEGRLDVKRFGQQQFALAESALAPALGGDSDSNGTVVDATSRFVAQGGIWTPSGELTRAIDDVAMGRRPCEHM
jgi:hypothetical protein